MTDQEEDRQNAMQKRADLQRYYPPKGFVPGDGPQPQLPARTEHNVTLDVPVNAVQVVSVQTTERDRSLGYLLRTVPLSVAFAIVATLLAVTLAEEPFLSWSGFIIFWVTFVAAWMYGEYRHGKSSPNAVALEEVRRKWNNIDRNDARRWDNWERLLKVTTQEPPAQSWLVRYRWYIALWVFVSLAVMVLAVLLLLAEGSR